MELTVGTFCLIFIISSCSTTLLPFNETEDREIILPRDFSQKTNETLHDDLNVPDRYKHQQEDEYGWEDERTISKRQHGYYYEPENYYRLNRHENNDDSNMGTIKVFRTYGKGKAQVTRQGQTVNVPNEAAGNNNKKSGNSYDNEIKPIRHRGVCRECPTDQTVVATKGHVFAILPEPCQSNPRMWNHYSGPPPGTKIREGIHLVRGYLGPKRKFCQYQYQVLVRHCEPLLPKEDIILECSADSSWGSICNVTCTNDKTPIGSTQLECREDLTWSSTVPLCKSKTDCTTPRVKAKSKISCETVNMTLVEGDFIPSGSTCKFLQNEKQVSINCKDGRWRIIRKNIPVSSKKIKSNKNKQEKSDPCKPNPCQNGGICLKPESSKGPPICKCRPQTQGLHCEMRECYYNICENDGLCFFQNDERVCYCAPEYSGDTCQHYAPQ